MLILIVKDTMCKMKMEQPHKVFVIKMQNESIISVLMAPTNQLEKHLTSRRSILAELKQNITKKEITNKYKDNIQPYQCNMNKK